MTSPIPFLASELSERLLSSGYSVSRTGTGKRVIFSLSEHLGEPSGGVLVAMEGAGCFFWDGEREVNSFRLLQSGFGLDVAATLAAVLNEVYHRLRHNRQESLTHDRQDPALGAPERRGDGTCEGPARDDGQDPK